MARASLISHEHVRLLRTAHVLHEPDVLGGELLGGADVERRTLQRTCPAVYKLLLAEFILAEVEDKLLRRAPPAPRRTSGARPC